MDELLHLTFYEDTIYFACPKHASLVQIYVGFRNVVHLELAHAYVIVRPTDFD